MPRYNPIKKGDKLTTQQKKFVSYYVKYGNATMAAVKAGYSERTARQSGSDLLTRPHIKEAVMYKLELMESKEIASAQEVMILLTKLARGKIKEEQIVVEQIGDYKSEARIMKKQVSAKDRLTAINSLAKRYGLDIRDNKINPEIESLAPLISLLKGENNQPQHQQNEKEPDINEESEGDD